ncbi:Transcription initiation factor TFIID subunit 4 [Strongyloides ratti]|uniref:Transcription initiation factor TFIID subunit 4 n=1 Tax=Strongyloides ratti TaxID=34506 RepID=A0A090L418_STRRB|nr:Transcription initiation factor TFIID subunit 4 [Strongyloides ratti]CEF64472.1 Transcription initiation factor TFIID subunit 4 [Strongyloides ratti]
MNGAVAIAQQNQSPENPTVMENNDDVVKCLKFLKTLISLPVQRKSGKDVEMKVQKLVKDIIFEEISIEEFATNLQSVLNSQAQPNLLPFLINAMPPLRSAVLSGRVRIEGLDLDGGFSNQRNIYQRPTTSNAYYQNSIGQNSYTHDQRVNVYTDNQSVVNNQGISVNNGQYRQIPQENNILHVEQQQQPYTTSTPVNYVNEESLDNTPRTSYGGHSLSRPSSVQGIPQQSSSQIPIQAQQQVIQGQSVVQVQQENLTTRNLSTYRQHSKLLNPHAIANRIARKFPEGLKPDDQAVYMLSHALEHRMKSILTSLSVAAEHRLEKSHLNPFYTQSSDCKKQIKFLEEISKKEQERRENRERESILRAKKSKNSDNAERQKAKEIQEADARAAQNKEANAAAIAALGGGRTFKRSWADPNPHDSNMTSGYASVINHRPRKKRITVRDLQFVYSIDPFLKKSKLRHKLILSTTPTDTL